MAEPLARRARLRRHQLYRDVMQPRPDEKVLDVGCGPQGLAGFEAQADITGLDAVERPGYPGNEGGD